MLSRPATLLILLAAPTVGFVSLAGIHQTALKETNSRSLVRYVSLEPRHRDPHGELESLEQQRERAEFILNVGTAIDVLRLDVPQILDKPPDLSIFAEHVRISDPTGEKVRGKTLVNQMYRMIRGMATIALQDSSRVKARFYYDEQARVLSSKINAELRVHGMPADGECMHIDVVSTYHFDTKGYINHHVVDRVELDGRSVEPFQFLTGDTLQLRDWLSGGRAIPQPRWGRGLLHPPMGLPAPGGLNGMSSSSRQDEDSHFRLPTTFNAEETVYDVYGNIVPKSMQKDGGAKIQKKSKPGFFDWLKSVSPEGCEEDTDCPSYLRCCDFSLTKVCCGGGLGAINPYADMAWEPVPVRVEDEYPPDFPSPPPQNPGPW